MIANALFALIYSGTPLFYSVRLIWRFFTQTLVLVFGKLNMALAEAYAGSRQLRARATASRGELLPQASLAQLLADPRTRRAVGLAEASAMCLAFVPFVMTDKDVLRVELLEIRCACLSPCVLLP